MPTKQADVISLSDDIRAAVQAWGQKPEPEYNSGDKCPACDGRIALMEEVIGEAQMDDEPYTSGIQEGDRGEYHQLQDTILISLLVCDQCGKVFSKHFED